MKKAQLTMIMIVGMVIFILVGLVMYLSKLSVKKQTDQGTSKTQETAIETSSFRDHMQQCLDKSAKDAIRNLGKQGGYIYISQGGPFADFQPTDRGVLFIDNEGYKVAYNIYPARSSSGIYNHQVPNYPWRYFPYDSSFAAEKYDGVFGINAMPMLHSYEGPSSIQSQIEVAVENNMQKCVDVESFKKRGYAISAQEPNARVTIASKDINIKLQYPITLSNPTMQESTEFSDFSVRYNLRLKELYLFAKDLINRDVRSVKFKIDSSDNNKDGFTVRISRNAFNSDDIITISDEKSLFEGKQLEYTFSRKNRAPALHYLKNNEQQYEYGHQITRAELLSGNSLEAQDPDEDIPLFKIKINEQEMQGSYDFVIPNAEFVVEASDGALYDYQIINVTRASS